MKNVILRDDISNEVWNKCSDHIGDWTNFQNIYRLLRHRMSWKIQGAVIFLFDMEK